MDRPNSPDSCHNIRLLTWNVNGLRSLVNKCFGGSLKRLLQSLNADVICFQETKIRRGELDRELALVEGWDSFFAFHNGKTGYSGVATFCRRSVSVPVHAEEGFTGILAAQQASQGRLSSQPPHPPRQPLPLPVWPDLTPSHQEAVDAEGRCVITDHGAFVLLNVYGPAITSEERAEERFAYKLQFFKALGERLLLLLSQQRPVILLGDLNISPQPLDSCSPDETFSRRPDRLWLNALLSAGGGPFEDVFRLFHPGRTEAYTCWSTATGARVNNYGSRIDLILAAQPRQQEQQKQQEGNWVQTEQEGTVGSELRSQEVGIGQQQQQQQQEGTAQGNTCQDHGGAMEQQQQQQGLIKRHHQQEQQQQDSGRPMSGPPSTPQTVISPLPAAAAGSSCRYTSSTALLSWVTDCQILPEVQGSDHAPVVAELRVPLQLLKPGGEPPPLATRFMFAGKQTSLKDFLGKFSGNSSSGGGSSRSSNGGVVLAAPAAAAGGYGGGGGEASGGAAAGAGAEGWAWKVEGGLCSGLQGATAAAGGSKGEAAAGPGDRGPWDEAKGGAVGHGGGSVVGAGSAPYASQVSRRGSGSSSSSKRGGSGGQSSLWGFVRPQAGATAATGMQPAVAAGAPSSEAAQPRLQTQAGGQGLPPATGDCDSGGAAAGCSSGDALCLNDSSWSCEGSGVQYVSSNGAAAALGAPSEPMVLSAKFGAQQLVQQPGAENKLTHAGAKQLQQQEQQPEQHPQQPVTEAGGAGDTLRDSQQHQSAVQAWQRISSMMAPPKCKVHQEPCVIRTVKKRGENNGRQFYVCARPDGPPPVGRCDFFLWASQRALKGSNSGGSRGKARGPSKGHMEQTVASAGMPEQKRPRLDGTQ